MLHNGLQICVYFFCSAFVRYHTAEILVSHGDGTVDQVTQCIRQIRIEPFYHQLPGYNAVIFKRHLVEYEITDRIYTKEIHQFIRIQHISPGFAHLAVSLEQPRMTEDLLRQRKIQRHQKNRPVNGMKTDDVLSDQMQVRRPVMAELFRAFPAALIPNPGDVIGQSVQPDIDHMLRIKVHRNPPLKGGSGYTQILQARKQEVIHHLVFPGYRLDKFRMGIDMLDQAVRILAHFKEIRFLPGRLHLAPAVRTFSVHQL